jgi:hypothetical protein
MLRLILGGAAVYRSTLRLILGGAAVYRSTLPDFGWRSGLPLYAA